MESLKRQFSQLQQSLKEQKAEAKQLKKTIKDMKTEYEEKFTVNTTMAVSNQERIQELEDWNQREDSAPAAQAALPTASRSSGNVDIGICQMSARRLSCHSFFLADKEVSAYWAKSGGETFYNTFLFNSGAWGDDRLELDSWLQSMFSPLLYPKDLAKMVTSCCPFLFFLTKTFVCCHRW